MYPFYEETQKSLSILYRTSKHVPPHLHHAVEFVYVTKGTLEIGVGQELYHMEEGDFAIVFPNVIHHYQVFSPGNNKAYYILASPAMCEPFQEELQKYCPQNPVISKGLVQQDIVNGIKCLTKSEKEQFIVQQAYVQIFLAKSIPCMKMVEKSSVGSEDIIYQSVSYIAAHFREDISLEKMASDLGVSKYVLSRVFSGTFHRNFNQYLNETRLNYAGAMLEYTSRTVTDICMESGFESQRTFNRVFMQSYRMTPREYRNSRKQQYQSMGGNQNDS